MLQGMKTHPTVVRDLMSVDVVTLGRNDKLAAAEDLMRLGRIRHLPVVDCTCVSVVSFVCSTAA